LQSLPVATALPHPNPHPREPPLSNFPPQKPPHHNPLPQAGEEANEKGDLKSPEEGANVSLRELLNNRRIFAFTTKGSLPYQAARFQAGDAFLFGPESRGLPNDVLESFAPEQRLRLPMLPNNRSLNLSNTVAVAVFEAWRQLEFSGAC
jgi:tRNA (cytidine/uridine-2'-O-)-methyltransferase